MDVTETLLLKDFIGRWEQQTLRQDAFNKTILDEVHTIKRGLYGDSLNGVPGLVQRQENDERERNEMKKDIQSLKGFRSRLIWIASGAVVGIQGLWEIIKWKSK